jgi:transcriptional regulator with XRE-family HTH domain
MDLAYRLRQIREWRKLSQGDIEKRTGLLRCYISRVENGHTAPSIETLEKISRALEVSLCQLLYTDGSASSQLHHKSGVQDWASRGKGSRIFLKFVDAISKMSEKDRTVLLHTATKMIERRTRTSKAAIR